MLRKATIAGALVAGLTVATSAYADSQVYCHNHVVTGDRVCRMVTDFGDGRTHVFFFQILWDGGWYAIASETYYD